MGAIPIPSLIEQERCDFTSHRFVLVTSIDSSRSGQSINSSEYTMAQILLNLPTDISVDIISNWIGAADAVKLDTAFCESTTRPKFEILLSNCTLSWALFQRYHTNHLAVWSVKRSVQVDSLHLNNASDSTVYMELLQKRGSRVRRIRFEFTSAGISHDLLSDVARYCSHLEDLNLVKSSESPGLDVPLKNILLNCTKLRALSFTYSAITLGLDGRSFHGIVCPHLCTLRLDFFYPVELFAALFMMTPNLTSLALLTSSFERNTGNDNVLQFISPKLKKLSFVGLADKDLIQIVNSCPHIESVTFLSERYGYTNITFAGVEYMAAHLTNLNSVDISSSCISDVCFCVLAEHRSQTLTSLDIVHSNELSVGAINAVLNQCTKLTHFGCHYNHYVKELDFAYLANITNLYFVLDGECVLLLYSIAQHCAALTHLSLDNLP